MIRRLARVAAGLLVLAAPVVAHAQLNVALGKPVALDGAPFGVTAGPIAWPDPPMAAAAVVTDGAFAADQAFWQDNSVYWDTRLANPVQSVLVSLLAPYRIGGLVLQADNNDEYVVDYRVGGGAWSTAWLVPVSCCDGVATRPDRGDDTRVHLLVAPILADEFRIMGRGGDEYYGITEFQAFAAVPEPSTVTLLGAGVLALAGLARRRRA